jgi:hypothetical protein
MKTYKCFVTITTPDDVDGLSVMATFDQMRDQMVEGWDVEVDMIHEPEDDEDVDMSFDEMAEMLREEQNLQDDTDRLLW